MNKSLSCSAVCLALYCANECAAAARVSEMGGGCKRVRICKYSTVSNRTVMRQQRIVLHNPHFRYPDLISD
jgi:hypothetical protein